MKNIGIIRLAKLCALSAFAVVLCGSGVGAQTTVFTYQGRLTDGSTAASGTYQMQFSLYDAASGPTQIGSTITDSNVAVTNGIFTVQLSFAAPNAFDGSPRWLEIAVRKASDPPGFTPLTPRQPITSSPYSIRTLSAAVADMAADTQAVGGTPAAQIIKEGDARLTDARTPTAGSTDYIQNTATQQPSSTFNVSGNGTVAGTMAATTVSVGSGGQAMNDNIFRLRGGSDNNHGLVYTAAVDGMEFRGNQGFRWMTGTAGVSERMRLDNTGRLNASIFSASLQFNIGNIRVLSIPGTNNTFVGQQAGAANTSGVSNSFFGLNAGVGNIGGSGNTFLGVSTGTSNTSGNSNTFVGQDAGILNTTGSLNIFIGPSAGRSNMTSSGNIFIGNNAGFTNDTGDTNVFVGDTSGFANTTGSANVFAGTNSGRANTTGIQNVFLGRASGFMNTTGDSNVAVGRSAGFTNSTSDGNTFVGTSAGAGMTGEGNVSIGFNSGFSATSGNNNVFIGSGTGANSSTGSNNTFVGAGVDTGGVSFTNATGLGSGTVVSRSNSVILGNNANVGVGTSAPAAKLQVDGGDLYIGTAAQGVILKSPAGTCYRITVSNAGVLSTALVTCPL